MRVRDVRAEDLLPPKKVRSLSPRQTAIRKREAVIGKALDDLRDSPESRVLKVELEAGEKLPTVRAAIARQIGQSASAVSLAVRNGTIYLSRRPISRRRTSNPQG